jgi:epoxyqueuosine reductase
MNLYDDLGKYAKAQGADLFGAADITQARDFILAQGGEHVAAFPRAVSIGIGLLDAVVDELYRHEEPSAIYTYRGLYNTVNNNLDRVSLAVAKKIQESNFRAYQIPAAQTVNQSRLMGTFSHKLAAHLAGLGWIGKSCLLINPEYGPRVRWATVLTDAPMETGKPMKNRCGDCRECVEVCPVKAFTGRLFNSSEPRDLRFRAHLCKDYTDKRAQTLGEGICGLCVYVCPYGRKKIKHQ